MQRVIQRAATARTGLVRAFSAEAAASGAAARLEMQGDVAIVRLDVPGEKVCTHRHPIPNWTGWHVVAMCGVGAGVGMHVWSDDITLRAGMVRR